MRILAIRHPRSRWRDEGIPFHLALQVLSVEELSLCNHTIGKVGIDIIRLDKPFSVFTDEGQAALQRKAFAFPVLPGQDQIYRIIEIHVVFRFLIEFKGQVLRLDGYLLTMATRKDMTL